MSITDELREWAEGNTLRAGMSLRMVRDQALAIADRIDAKHERAEQDLIDANKVIAKLGNNVAREYVKLPVGADGKAIRVGDKLDGYGETITVYELRLGESLWAIVDTNGDIWSNPCAFSHSNGPTVEDVLRSFGVDIAHALNADPNATVPEAIIAEYIDRIKEAAR